MAASWPSSPPIRTSAAPFFYAGNNDYTATELTPPEHLWVVSANGGTARRLDQRLLDDRTDRSGRHLLAANRLDARRSIDRLHARRDHVQRRRRILDALAGRRPHGGAMRKLTGHSDFELSPSYSPDGSRLAYWYPRGGDFTAEKTVRIRCRRTRATSSPALSTAISPDRSGFPTGGICCSAPRAKRSNRLLDRRTSGRQQPARSRWARFIRSAIRTRAARSTPASPRALRATERSRSSQRRAASARELYLLARRIERSRGASRTYNDFLAGIAPGAMTSCLDGPRRLSEDGVVTYPPNRVAGPRSIRSCC